MSLRQALDLFRVSSVLLSDWPRETVDAIFFHSRAWHDDDGLFELVAEMYHGGYARFVVINGGDGRRVGGMKPGESWPGVEYYKKRLADLNVDRIYCHPPAEHTRGENDGFLCVAREHAWKSAVVVSHPHQLPRAFLGLVKSMTDQGYWLRVYAVTPASTDWRKEVFGSQGMEQIPRFEHIEKEFDRIFEYQDKGDLATFEQFCTYMHRRSEIL